MPNTILHKRNGTANASPTASSLAVGELAINTADGTVFTKRTNGSVVNVAALMGTWTPVIEQASAAEIAGLTYAASNGNWVRIGGSVWVQGVIELSAVPTPLPASALHIAGLPYSFIGNGGGGVIYGMTNVNVAGAHVSLRAFGAPDTQFRFQMQQRSTTGNTFTATQMSVLTATSILRFFSVYRTNDAP